jgi:APA family basic amino acid/polyamine antiporter
VLATPHPRFQTPVLAVVITAAVTLVFTLSSTFLSALTISAVTRLSIYAVTSAALPFLRQKPDLPPPSFRAPAGPVVAGGAVGLAVWLLSNSTLNEARVVGIAAGVGVIVYAAARQRGVGLTSR